MKRTMKIAAAASAALLLAACGTGQTGTGGGGGDGGDGENSDKPYRIVVTGGVSAQGVMADLSGTSVNAAKAAVEDVNANGGIAGRQIELVVVDDTGDPTTAVTKLREEINGAGVDAWLNSGPSTIAAATLPILTQNNILSFNIGPTADSADPSVNPLNFDLSPGPAEYLAGFVVELESTDYQKVGIIHGSTAYGQTFGRMAGEILPEAGYEIVGNQEYDSAALDMTPQLQALQAAQPDVLIFDGYGAPVGYVLQSKEKLGWDIPMLANNSVASTSIVSQPPPDGVLGTDQVKGLKMQVAKSIKHDPGADNVNHAVELMKEQGPIKTTLVQAYNWDAPHLIAAAAEKVGHADSAEELAKALEDPEVQEAANVAMISRYNFSADSHGPNVSGDEFIFVEPSEIKDGQFQ